MRSLAGRWFKFNLVGGVGIGVQLAALWFYEHSLHLHYLVATALAVETAVLHNFVWHERFTWKERAGGTRRDVAARLLRFHLGNGLVSIAGNLLLMKLFAGVLGMRHLLANTLAIAICSFANFAAGEWFVFRESKR